MKNDLLNFTQNELSDEIEKYGFEKYRAVQIFNSLHGKFAGGINSIKGIPLKLKELLVENFYADVPEIENVSVSETSGTEKFLFSFSEKKIFTESVLIAGKKRTAICVSSQEGCSIGCVFCATGQMNYGRNLSAGQIVSQIYAVARYTGAKPANIVFMGMGEPLLNLDNVVKSLKILTDDNGLGIASGRITVSTVGLINKIKMFADLITSQENRKIRNTKLAFSLQTTDNGRREKLIPAAKYNRLDGIYKELIYFYRKTGTKITYEYIFLPGFNNAENDIKRLSKLSYMIPCNINVIRFHPVKIKKENIMSDIINNNPEFYKESYYNKELKDFIEKLKSLKVTVNLRESSGIDINAACGQLAAKRKE